MFLVYSFKTKPESLILRDRSRVPHLSQVKPDLLGTRQLRFPLLYLRLSQMPILEVRNARLPTTLCIF